MLGEIWIRSFDADTGTVGVVLWSGALSDSEMPTPPKPEWEGKAIAVEIEFDHPEVAFPLRNPPVESILQKLKSAGHLTIGSLKIDKLGDPRTVRGRISFDGAPTFKRVHLSHWVNPGILALSTFKERGSIESVELSNCDGNVTSVDLLLQLENLSVLRISGANNVAPPPQPGRFVALTRLELNGIVAFCQAAQWLSNARCFAPALEVIELTNLVVQHGRPEVELSSSPGVRWIFGDGVKGLRGIEALLVANGISDLVTAALTGNGTDSEFAFPLELGYGVHGSHVHRLLRESSLLKMINLEGVASVGLGGWKNWLPPDLGSDADEIEIRFPCSTFGSSKEIEDLFSILLGEAWGKLRKISFVKICVTGAQPSTQKRIQQFAALAVILGKTVTIGGEAVQGRSGFAWIVGGAAVVELSNEDSVQLASTLLKIRTPMSLDLDKKGDVDACEFVQALQHPLIRLTIAGSLHVDEVRACLKWTGAHSDRMLNLTRAMLNDIGISLVSQFIENEENEKRVELSEEHYEQILGVKAVAQQYLVAMRWALEGDGAI